MNMVDYESNSPHRAGPYNPAARDIQQYPHLEHAQAQHPSTPSPPFSYVNLPPQYFQSLPQQQQVPTSRSTPTSYPSPVSYPSPSMSSYSGYPPQAHNSPYQANVAPYSLPPIRMTPPAVQATPQQFGPPLALLYSPHASHQSPHGMPPSTIHHPSQTPMRYPLPQVTPERIMSGGRHKKEIKRRTKTGCLTCRKRRIKCDEAHPTCKNCTKSKRDCLGYDPIFKSQPGPAAIQPAPSSAPGPGNAPMPQITHPQITHSQINHTYAPIAHPVAMHTYAAPQSTTTASPVSSYDPCDCSAIDPALESATPVPPYSAGMVMFTGNSPPYRTDAKRTYDRISPYSSSVEPAKPTGSPNSPSYSISRDSSNSSNKRIKIDFLLTGVDSKLPLTPPSVDQPQQESSSDVQTPQLQQSKLQYCEGGEQQQTQSPMEQTISMYRMGLAPKLDVFFETGWFQTRGVERVMRGGIFTEQLGHMFRKIYDRQGVYEYEEDPTLVNFTGDAEVLMKAIKLLFGICPTHGATVVEDNIDYAETSDIINRNQTIFRVSIMEALLSKQDGKKLDVRASPRNSQGGTVHYESEYSSSYWNALARVVEMDSEKHTEAAFDRAMEEIKRNIQDSWSRDVVYQLTVARHLHMRLESQPPSPGKMTWRRTKEVSDQARAVVHGAARTAPERTNPNEPFVTRRIAGLAMGIWGRPILDCEMVV